MASDRRNIIVPLLILGFIFLSPDPARSPQSARFHSSPTLDDVIAQEQTSLSELQNSTFAELGLGTDRYPSLNLTGLEPERGYAWDALPAVQGRVQEHAKYAGFDGSGNAPGLSGEGEEVVPLYRNVTGYVHGEWTRSRVEVQTPQLNMSEYAPPTPFGPAQRPILGFMRNITGDEGGLRLRFREREGVEAELVQEDGGLTVVEMEVELTIEDEVKMLDYEMRLPGVYFPELGQAVLTTTSDKFAGMFALPHLMLSNSMFQASRDLLNTTISAVIQRQIDRDTISHNPWSSAPAAAPPPSPFASPSCELILFLQQLPPVQSTAAYTSTVLHFLENELRFPTGAFVPTAPELRFSMIAFSPDCGYVLESKGPPDYIPQEATHLTGPKLEALHIKSRHHILFFTLTLSAQLFLLMRQMRESSTPSTRSRISFYTIGLLALGDGFTTMTFLLTSLFIGGLWINLVGTAFLAFVSVSFFGMRFLMDIWATQAPEREAAAREEAEQEREREERFRRALQELRDRQAREREDARAREQGTEGNVATPGAGQNAPATQTPPTTTQVPPSTNTTEPAQQPNTTTPQPPGALPASPPSQPQPQQQPPSDTGATPVFMPSDQEGLVSTSTPPTTAPGTAPPLQIQTQTFGALYTRFYLLLLASLFLSLNASTWPSPLKRTFFTLLAFIYLSFWLPQINRNVQRNCRKALSWEFVVGQSVLRLLPMAYFYAYEGNVLFAPPDYTSLAVLGGWVWVQLVLLGSQELIGPRWFVRKGWAPEAWDYHPVLREDEEGATLPIGFEESLSQPSSPIKERRRSSVTSPASATLTRTSTHDREKEKEKDPSKRTFTCAICMQDLSVPIVPAGESAPSGPAGLLQRRQYMVTPCRHIFHSGCLEGWMKYRLVCPVCREGVPGL